MDVEEYQADTGARFEKIYRAETGVETIQWRWVGFHSGDYYPDMDAGWREKKDGTPGRERVYYVAGFWKSDVEINTARVHARTF